MCYLLTGGWQWLGAKSYLGPAEFDVMCLENATIACSIVVAEVSSHRRSCCINSLKEPNIFYPVANCFG